MIRMDSKFSSGLQDSSKKPIWTGFTRHTPKLFLEETTEFEEKSGLHKKFQVFRWLRWSHVGANIDCKWHSWGCLGRGR